LVAAAHPAGDRNPSRNRRRVSENGGDCGASSQRLGAVQPKPANEVITDYGALPGWIGRVLRVQWDELGGTARHRTGADHNRGVKKLRMNPIHRGICHHSDCKSLE